MTSNSQCDIHDLECACGTTVAAQSLDELEFERGIWGAAYEGDASRVDSLLNRVFGVDKLDAAGKFQKLIIKFIEVGYYGKKSLTGYTALHYAARNGHLDICKGLLNHGANINAVTRAGKASALHRAASAGKYNYFL